MVNPKGYIIPSHIAGVHDGSKTLVTIVSQF